ncbi:MAG: hypothetical protein EBR09_07080 [Proteobacteria bacterium]|nr:hypothetical protein [Pseudomonadota bacterium]
MYILLARKEHFLQLGLSRIETYEDYIAENIFGLISKSESGRRAGHIVFINLFKRNNFSHTAALRLSIKGIERISHHSQGNLFLKESGTNLFLWDLDEGKNLGNLPLKLNGHIDIIGEAGVVRINSGMNQSLVSAGRVFEVCSRAYVVSRYSGNDENTRKTSRTARLFIYPASVVTVSCALWTAVAAGWKFSTGTVSLNSSQEPQAQTQPQIFNSEKSEDTLPESSISQMPVRSAESSRQPTTPPSAKPTPVKIKPVPAANQLQNSFDPMRCQPITQKYESRSMNRFAQRSAGKGEWYVCR